MKKFKFLFILSIFFVSCATTIETEKNNSSSILKENEGFILLRILNPNVGKTIDKFYYTNGKIVQNQSSLHLNSDLQYVESRHAPLKALSSPFLKFY